MGEKAAAVFDCFAFCLTNIRRVITLLMDFKIIRYGTDGWGTCDKDITGAVAGVNVFVWIGCFFLTKK